jgi:excisionase family DNA binding protein
MPLAKLPTKQAAAHVGLTVPTLLRKARRGEIGYEKLGHRTIYFYEAELQEWLRKQQRNQHVSV